MFFDLSSQKFVMLTIIISSIILGLAVFLAANNAFSILPQAGYQFNMQTSALRYQLFYQGNYYAVGGAPNDTGGAVAHSMPVLLYHGEAGGPDMPTAVFVDQMRALKAAGWQTVTMQQFDEWMQGKIQLPDKSFLLTFDDGRTDTYYPVDPVLKDLGYHAVMFTITKYSLPTEGKSLGFYLNETDLKNMIASGRWDIESHGDADHSVYSVQTTTDLSQSASTTQGHFLSNKFWDSATNSFETNAEFSARVQKDLQTAKDTIEQKLNVPVIAFAYPFNDFGQDSVNFPGSQRILDSVVPSIYRYAFYQTWPGNGDAFNYPGVNDGPGSRPYMIKRIEPGNSWTGADLLAVLNNGAAKSLPYNSSALGNEWGGTWGDVQHMNGSLHLSASAETTGSSAFLDGSGWWKDYRFDALVSWKTGESVSLLARANAGSYLACAFSDNRVSLERHFGAQQVTIATVARTFSGSYTASRFSMSVAGMQASCAENGTPVVSGTIGSVLPSGGVGVEIWAARNGEAAASFSNVSVQGIGAANIPNVPNTSS